MLTDPARNFGHLRRTPIAALSELRLAFERLGFDVSPYGNSQIATAAAVSLLLVLNTVGGGAGGVSSVGIRSWTTSRSREPRSESGKGSPVGPVGMQPAVRPSRACVYREHQGDAM